jgi:hypothetical protein
MGAIADHLDRVARSGCGHSAEIQRRADLSARRVGVSASALDRAPSYVELLTCLEMANRPKSYRLNRLWAPLQTGAERQDFLPGGLL